MTFPEAFFRRLLDGVFDRSPIFVKITQLHGASHWRRIAANGLELCEETVGADPHVVLLFAAFHDARRLRDDRDPDHGKRGATLARRLRERGLFEATDEQMELLIEACARHTDGETTDDPTIGVCWDADRLDLPRVGIRPKARMLSTAAAKSRITTHNT